MLSDFCALELSILTTTQPSLALQAFKPDQHDTLRAMHVSYWEGVAQSDPYADVLGDLYMQIRSRYAGQSLGQYFTPSSIARLICSINLTDWKPKAGPIVEQLTTLQEPASGSGALLLQAAATLYEAHGPDALVQWAFIATDIDPLCAQMTAIQLLANAMVWQAPFGRLLVRHANGLQPIEDTQPHQVVIHAEHESRATVRQLQALARLTRPDEPPVSLEEEAAE